MEAVAARASETSTDGVYSRPRKISSARARSSVGERSLHTREVAGSKPAVPIAQPGRLTEALEQRRQLAMIVEDEVGLGTGIRVILQGAVTDGLHPHRSGARDVGAAQVADVECG